MVKKNKIIITGGAGFVGTNLIKFLLNKSNYKIISIDNYSSGTKLNHIKNSRVKYIKGNTVNISKLIKDYKQIKSVFHFGEFARIYQSFIKTNECIESNSVGSNAVFNFCLRNKIKLIYSATSASLGNKGDDKNLSPYAFSKAKNLELLKPLPVVRPGTQTRRFTHIDDTVYTCYLAWRKNLCRHYIVASKKSYSILEVAKLFKSKIKFFPKRPGERYASAIIHKNLSNKMYKYFGKIDLKNYISNFIKENN